MVQVSRAHLAQNDVNFAIAACLNGVREYPKSPSPVLVLYCLYAVNYDYYNAIKTFYKFSLQCKSLGDSEDIYKKLNLPFPRVDNNVSPCNW